MINQRGELFSPSKLPERSILSRYYTLPYAEELEKDIELAGCKLVQTAAQHKYIADFDYYNQISDLTFKTWRLGNTAIPDIPLVVKGVTNSKKWNWDTEMFATNRRDALKIASKLSSDGVIGYQEIILREYVPLKTIEVGINGLPFTEEYRCFFIGGRFLASGFYWSTAENAEEYTVPQGVEDFARKVSERIKDHTNFYSIDIAKTESGQYICVEVNCGTMSGLSCIDPDYFYKKLSEV